MSVTASSLFARDERVYREMLDHGGILVGDRWFRGDSTELERTKYLVAYLRRKERNHRRRERRKSVEKKEPTMSGRGPLRIPADPESQRRNRLPLERRKCLRRTTLADCPTAAEIRTAWHYRNRSEANRIRLGALLMDLECYVDNSLIRVVRRGRAKIVARAGGLKAWIRENCPELDRHYKTLQRIKGRAKRLRQSLDILDPVPLTALLASDVAAADLTTAKVHIQPRKISEDPVRDRFAWERSPLLFDTPVIPISTTKTTNASASPSPKPSEPISPPIVRSSTPP